MAVPGLVMHYGLSSSPPATLCCITAGSNDGNALDASFSRPAGLAISGSMLYVAGAVC